MADYTNTFPGATGTTITASELTTEFDAIETAVATKFDSASADAYAFKTITVSGQPNVVADQAADTLTLVAGSNITITTVGDQITFAATGGGATQNLWETFVADTGSSTANTATDSFTFTGGTGINTTISGDTMTVSTNAGEINHDSLLGFVGNEHVNHSSVSITAGVGLSGGGTIAATRTLNLDISGLSALSGTSVVATDGYLVDDGGVMKRIAHQSAGIPVVTQSTTSRTLADGDANKYIRCTSGSPTTITLNTGVGEQGNVIIIEQAGAGQVTVAGTATINAANGLKTASQYSVIVLVSYAANSWTLYGDATT